MDDDSVIQSKSSIAGVEVVYLDKVYELDDLKTKKKKKLEIIMKDAKKL